MALSKAANARSQLDDATLQMEEVNNWPDKILPAPFTICILGKLTLITSEHDFKLTRPEGGFKLVKWPDSIGASLLQVTHSGHHCFMEAHSAMDVIQMHTGNVPKHLTNSVKILTRGSNEDVEDLLPVELNAIKKAADECKLRAERVANEFQTASLLIQELFEACKNTKSVTEETNSKLTLEIELQKQRQQNLKTAKDNLEEKQKRAEEEYKKAMDRYDKVLDSAPGLGEMIGLSLLDSVSSILSAPKAVLTTVATQYCKGAVNTMLGLGTMAFQEATAIASEEAIETPRQEKKKEKETKQEDLKLYKGGIDLRTAWSGLGNCVFDANQQLSQKPHGMQKLSQFFREPINKTKADVDRTKQATSLRAEVMCLLSEAESFLDQIENYDPKNANDDLYENWEDLDSKLGDFKIRADHATDAPLLDSVAPHQSQTQKPSATFSEQYLQQQHAKGEAAQARLKDTDENMRDIQKKFDEVSDNCARNMEELTKFEADKATAEDILRVLTAGIVQLGQLCTEWNKISIFFDHISNIISTCLSTQLTHFVDYAKKQQKRICENEKYEMSDAVRDIMYNSVLDAVKFSYVVNNMASGYYRISDKFLMPDIAQLGELMAVGDKTDRQMKQQQLENRLKETQNAIRDEMNEHVENVRQRIQSRIEQIRKVCDEHLPPIEASKKQEIVAKVGREIKKSSRYTTEEEDLDQFAL